MYIDHSDEFNKVFKDFEKSKAHNAIKKIEV